MDPKALRHMGSAIVVTQSFDEFKASIAEGVIYNFRADASVPKNSVAAVRRQLWPKVTGSRCQRKAKVAALIRGGKSEIARFLATLSGEAVMERVVLKRLPVKP